MARQISKYNNLMTLSNQRTNNPNDLGRTKFALPVTEKRGVC